MSEFTEAAVELAIRVVDDPRSVEAYRLHGAGIAGGQKWKKDNILIKFSKDTELQLYGGNDEVRFA